MRPSPEEVAELNLGSTRELEPPRDWSQGDDILVPLDENEKNEEKYTKVKEAFESTIIKRPARIVKIERVQNLAMWQSYVVKRKTMIERERELSESPLEEESLMSDIERRWLWHGTDKTTVQKIIRQGFDKAFCGRNATKYGRGIYFATKTSKSAKFDFPHN